jgi:hypothetical protein
MSDYGLMVAPNYGASRNPFNYEKIEQIDRDLSSVWLTLNEITQQLNLFEDESQDTYLSSLELAVRMSIEDFLGLTIFPVTFKVYYGSQNTFGVPAMLDLPEVSEAGITIDEVGYYTTDSNNKPLLNIVLPTDYFYDQTGNKIVLNTLPNELNTTMTNPIYVIYSTQPSFIAQYPVVKQAGLLLFTHLYNNRSNTTNGVLHEIPFGVAQLLRPYKPLVM